MKNYLLLPVSITVLVFTMAACGEKKPEQSDAAASETGEVSASAVEDETTKDTAGQTVCPVSGEVLGSMGEPIVVMHEGKEVKLCCKSCIKKFNADPATYTAKVHGS